MPLFEPTILKMRLRSKNKKMNDRVAEQVKDVQRLEILDDVFYCSVTLIRVYLDVQASASLECQVTTEGYDLVHKPIELEGYIVISCEPRFQSYNLFRGLSPL